MKLFKTLIISAFILSTMFGNLLSQEDVLRPRNSGKASASSEKSDFKRRPFYIGVEGGLNTNFYSQNLAWSSPVPNSVYNAYSSGLGFSPYFAALIDLPLSSSWSLQGRLTYDAKSFSNSYTGIVDNYDVNSGTTSDASEEMKYTATCAYFGISIFLRYDLTDNLFLVFGPTIQLPLDRLDQTNTQTLLSPGAYFDLTTLRTVNTFKTDPATGLNARIGAEFGVGYKIPLSKKILLVPQARFQFMPTLMFDNQLTNDGLRSFYGNPVLAGTDNLLHSLQVGLGIWFKI
jgi:hypothetical protein